MSLFGERVYDFGCYWRLNDDRAFLKWSYWRISYSALTGELWAFRNNHCSEWGEGRILIATIKEMPLVSLVMTDWPDMMHNVDSIDLLCERAQEAEKTGTIDGYERIDARFLLRTQWITDGVPSYSGTSPMEWFKTYCVERMAAVGLMESGDAFPDASLIWAGRADWPELRFGVTMWL